MKIENGKELLVLRFNNYKSHNFIDEHQNIIKSNGDTWILKGGRPITQIRINEVMKNGFGFLLLKEPKKDGGKYYVANIKEMMTGSPKPGMKYPSYYKEMIDDFDCFTVDSLNGTWIYVGRIIEVGKEFVSHLYLLSNGKALDNVLSSTMSSMLFVTSDVELKVKE